LAFQHDPNPSTIDESQFPGNWTNTLRAYNSTRNSAIDAMRVQGFLAKEFREKGAGPGGPLDLKIWFTPSFAPDKVESDINAWKHLVAYPTQTVNRAYGQSMYTTHDEMISFIEKFPRTNLTLEYLGEIPRGFPFPILVFSKSADRSPAGLAATGKPLVWIQGNIHGGEWSGPEGATALAHDLAIGRYDNLLEKVNVIIIPRVNADGAKRPIRATYDLAALQWTPTPEDRDLNRDNLLFDLPVSRVMKKLFVAYKPHFSVDLHERGAVNINSTINNTFGLKVDDYASDVGASGTNLPNATEELIALRYDYLEPDLREFAKKYGLYFGFYRESTDVYYHGSQNNYALAVGAGINDPNVAAFVGAQYQSSMIRGTVWDPDAPYYLISEVQFNPRNTRNINAFYGTVSQLFENKSGPTNVGNRGMWERRVATAYVCALSTITTAANRGDEILPKLEAMRRKWIEQGKTVTEDDRIPLLAVQKTPPQYVDWEWSVIDVDRNYAYPNATTGSAYNPSNPVEDFTGVVRYDATKALKQTADGAGFNGSNYIAVSDDSGSRDHQFFKVEQTWRWNVVRDRVRPYAYLIEGPYANELVTRMMLGGIEVKRLAQDVEIDVEGWYYNDRTVGSGGVGPYVDLGVSGSGGWLNRDVTVYPIENRLFKKDTFVVYLSQVSSNLIPLYLEPDFPYNVGSCIFLPYMSVALGGRSSGALSAELVGREMPAYRYLIEADLPTYDVGHYLPLINRGAVPRFLSYHTQEQINDIAFDLDLNVKNIKAYDYDIQVHTRTDALVDGKFDITLPTSELNSSYKILRNDGTYEDLTPHSSTLGWNVATVILEDHGNDPFTIDIDGDTDRPKVGDGSSRTLPHPLPENDDLAGIRIVEITYGDSVTPETTNEKPNVGEEEEEEEEREEREEREEEGGEGKEGGEIEERRKGEGGCATAPSVIPLLLLLIVAAISKKYPK
jgi:hypothetical protein